MFIWKIHLKFPELSNGIKMEWILRMPSIWPYQKKQKHL